MPMTKLENTENKTANRMLAISLAHPDAPVAGAGDVGFMQSPWRWGLVLVTVLERVSDILDVDERCGQLGHRNGRHDVMVEVQ